MNMGRAICALPVLVAAMAGCRALAGIDDNLTYSPDANADDAGQEDGRAAPADAASDAPVVDAAPDAPVVDADSGALVLSLGPSAPTAQYGDSDGGPSRVTYCPGGPPGQVVVGYAGYADDNTPGYSWWGQIGAVCGIPTISGTQPSALSISIAAGATLPLEGDVAMDGTAMYSVMCPANQVAVGFDGLITAPGPPAHLHFLSLACAPINITRTASGTYGLSIGSVQTTAGAGFDAGAPFPDTRCATGSVMTGTNVVAPQVATAAAYGVQAFGAECSPILVAN